MKIPIPYCGRLLQFKKRIFMTGGRTQLQLTREFIESDSSWVTLSDMINGRYGHCMLLLDENRFCVIGGYNNTGEIKECEEYNIIENKWKLMPALNGTLYLSSGIRTANKFIYIFGGSRNGSDCNTIEYIDLLKLDKWIILELQTNECSSTYYSLLIELSSKEILIFKGIGTNEVFTLNLLERTLKPNKSISITSDCFFQPFFIGDIIYSIGFNGNIHTYKPSTNTYKGIEYSKAIQ